MRVHELFKEPFTLDGVDFTISASLGISVFPRDAIDGKSLLSHADVAMYRSKGGGPGGTVVYSTDRENPMRRLRLDHATPPGRRARELGAALSTDRRPA